MRNIKKDPRRDVGRQPISMATQSPLHGAPLSTYRTQSAVLLHRYVVVRTLIATVVSCAVALAIRTGLGAAQIEFVLEASFVVIGAFGAYMFISSGSLGGLSFRAIGGFFVFIFFFVAPYAMWATGRWSIAPLDLGNGFGLKVNGIVLLGIVSFESIYLLAWWRGGRSGGGGVSGAGEGVSIAPLLLTYALGGTAIAVLGVDFFLFRAATVETGVDSARLLVLQLGSKNIALFSLGYYIIAYQRTRKAAALALLVLAVGANAVLNSPLGSARFFSFIIIVALFGILFQRSRYRALILASLMLAGFLSSTIFGAVRHARTLEDARAALVAAKTETLSAEMLFTGAFDAYEIMSYGVQYVSDRGITWGRQLSGAVLFWIPRSMWPSKPVGTGRELGEGYIGGAGRLVNVNLSAPLPLEGYINYGAVGVVLVMGGFAGIAGLLDRKSVYAIGRPVWKLEDFLYYASVGWSLFLWRGDLMNSLAFVTALGAGYFCCKLSVRFGRLE